MEQVETILNEFGVKPGFDGYYSAEYLAMGTAVLNAREEARAARFALANAGQDLVQRLREFEFEKSDANPTRPHPYGSDRIAS